MRQPLLLLLCLLTCVLVEQVVRKEDGNVMTPICITCDPARDTPKVVRQNQSRLASFALLANPIQMKEYLEEFHPDLIGLTGKR